MRFVSSDKIFRTETAFRAVNNTGTESDSDRISDHGSAVIGAPYLGRFVAVRGIRFTECLLDFHTCTAFSTFLSFSSARVAVTVAYS